MDPTNVRHPIQSLDFEQIQVQIQMAPLTVDTMQAFLAVEDARIRQLLAARNCAVPRRAFLVLDGSNELVPPAAVRRLQAEWMKRNEHLLRTIIHAMGVVIPNALARGAFTAVMWLAGDRVPWDVVPHSDLRSAIDWAIREAQAIGATVSEELLRDRAVAVERRRAQLTGRPVTRQEKSA